MTPPRRASNELPSSWGATTIGEVALEILGGGTPDRRNPTYYSGSIPWMTIKDMRTRRPEDTMDHITQDAISNSATRLVPADTLIVATRVGLGKVARVLYPTAINQDLKAIILPNLVDKGFLEYWFVANGDLIDSLGTGTTVKGIRLEDLRNLSIPLAPHAEQMRIVQAIDAQFTRLDSALDSLERVRAKLKRYRASVLKAACEGTLFHYVPGKQRGWQLKPWAELAERVTVGYVGPMKTRYTKIGIPFLRSQNVRENRFDPEGLLFIPEEFHRELSKSTLHAGDLVVVRSGSVGVTCVVPETLGEANCSDLVIVQRPRGVLAHFGAYFMNGVARPQIERGKVGVALIHFNTKSVAAMEVPVPPLEEQHRIVAEVERRLSVADAIGAEIGAGIARCARLRRATLKKAFEGRLVPQDPNDEPVGALLKRLVASRAHGAPRGRLQNGAKEFMQVSGG